MGYKDRNKQRAYQLEFIQKRRAAWFLENGPCRDCGSTDNLEVHHVNRDDKVTHRVWSWSKVRRDKELLKCVALCKECHGKITREQLRKPVVHGRHTVYANGCRCQPCKVAHREYMREYYARKVA